MPEYYLIVLFISVCFASILYWHVLHPVVLKAIQFRLFARRDQLRRLAIENVEDPNSLAYREVEEFICKSIAVVPAFSLASFLWFIFCDKESKEEESERVQRLHRIRQEGSKKVLELLDRSIGDSLIMMFINSPIVAICVWLVVWVLWVIDKINRFTIYRRVEDFVDTLPGNIAGIPAQ
jgi:hypothetical protein